MPAKNTPNCSTALQKLVGATGMIPTGYVAWTGTVPLWARIWIGTAVSLWLLSVILLGLLKAAE